MQRRKPRPTQLPSTLLTFIFISLVSITSSSSPDAAAMEELKSSLKLPPSIDWSDPDPCKWPHVGCDSGNRVTRIQLGGSGISGSLSSSISNLTSLVVLELMNNHIAGALPSLRGLSHLEILLLHGNGFTSIPPGFFDGLSSLQVAYFDSNPFDAWSIPQELRSSSALQNFSANSANVVGVIPVFFSPTTFPRLTHLRLSSNGLEGGLPAVFSGLSLRSLWLSGQKGGSLGGSIEVLGNMTLLEQVWLNLNSFTGPIPDLSGLTRLWNLNLRDNTLTGSVPPSLMSLSSLRVVNLTNNHLQGPAPKFSNNVAVDMASGTNRFCLTEPGVDCDSWVDSLIAFLQPFGYPLWFAENWRGNDPCNGWSGITCSSDGNITEINLQDKGLAGNISPVISKLASVEVLVLSHNSITGTIPEELASMPKLNKLDVSFNQLHGKLPRFAHTDVDIAGNPDMEDRHPSTRPPSPVSSPPPSPVSSPPPSPVSSPPPSPVSSPPPSPSGSPPSPVSSPPPSPVSSPPPSPVSSPPPSPSSSPPSPVSSPSPSLSSSPPSPSSSPPPSRSSSPPSPVSSPPPRGDRGPKIAKLAVIGIGAAVVLLLSATAFCLIRKKQKHYGKLKKSVSQPSSFGSRGDGKISISPPSYFGSRNDSKISNLDPSRLVYPIEELRVVTNNFSDENILGRGGSGTVYEGRYPDGNKIAVKVIYMAPKGQQEFESELRVLTKVRHKNLVPLLGYAMAESMLLLVYQYMPQGTLQRLLFHWEEEGLNPLSWKQRLSIALDVAKGVEYLHSTSDSIFIHRDLKPSNILLEDNMQARVSDFGLVRHASEGTSYYCTMHAGTRGYLAPECAMSGWVSTKVDVYSYGVILMQLITGCQAIDETRTGDGELLANKFKRSFKESVLPSMIDPVITSNEETLETVQEIAALASHCCMDDKDQRPNMSQVVAVLAPIVHRWKPCDTVVNYSLMMHHPRSITDMIARWKEDEMGATTSAAGLGQVSCQTPFDVER